MKIQVRILKQADYNPLTGTILLHDHGAPGTIVNLRFSEAFRLIDNGWARFVGTPQKP